MTTLPSVGDPVIHLAAGLATIADVRTSAGDEFLVVRVDATGEEHWIPAGAWTVQLRPVPSAAEANAWRAAIASTPVTAAAATEAARERRSRTLRHRDFERQAAALREAYACGDTDAALEPLEARVLPVYARALGMSTDALRDELRAMRRPRIDAAPAAPLPALVLGAVPLGRIQLGDAVVVGDPGGHGAVELETLAGEWLAYDWSLRGDVETARVIAIHRDHAGRWAELGPARAQVGTPSADGAQALIYDASVVEDDAMSEEIYDPVEGGLIAGRGCSTSLGGDGAYVVETAEDDGRVVAIVAGNRLGVVAERILRGDDLEEIVLDALAERHEPTDADGTEYDEDELEDEVLDGEPADRARTVLALLCAGRIASTPALEAMLAHIAEADADAEKPFKLLAIEALINVSSDRDRWMTWLIERFEATGDLAVGRAITDALSKLRDPAMALPIVERLEHPRWAAVRPRVIEVLASTRHPAAANLTRQLWRDETATPWTRAHAGGRLLELTGECEVATWLRQFVDEYSMIDRSADRPAAGFGNDFDKVADPLSAHARACDPCRDAWLRTLTRVRDSNDDERRRLVFLAPGHIAELTRT